MDASDAALLGVSNLTSFGYSMWGSAKSTASKTDFSSSPIAVQNSVNKQIADGEKLLLAGGVLTGLTLLYKYFKKT